MTPVTLSSPLERGRLRLKNRIVFPGHQTLLSDGGVVGERMRGYYGERAKGGVAAVIVEGAAVHPTTKKFPAYLLAYDAMIVPSLDQLADELHRYDCKAIVQLAHSGSRMPSLDSQRELWAPSDVRSAISPESPHAMTVAEIDELLDGYAAAAVNVVESRCDGIELHSAHEYLPGEFLSPVNNHRRDAYGGSPENRMRFLLEALERVRTAVGEDFVVGLRINGSDLGADGLEIEDYVEICARVAATGMIDYVSVSAGTSAANHMIVPPMDVQEGVYVPYAAAIRAEIDVPVFAVGRIKRPEHANEILAAGAADAVAMARALIADPQWPRKAVEAPERIRPCIGCNQGCFGNLYAIRAITCTVNPAVGRESERGVDTIAPAGPARRIAVVGGGPAGLEAALTAAGRGHAVVLYERDERLGGQVHLAAGVPARAELLELVEFQIGEVQRLGVEVHAGQAASAQLLAEAGFDHVVVATGSRPREAAFAAGGVPVLSPHEALVSDGEWRERRVLVVDEIGHFPAYVPAEALADRGASVSVVTPRLSAGGGLDQATLVTMHRRLAGKGVRFIVHAAAIATDESGLRLRDTLSDEEWHEAADVVVAAVGGLAEDRLMAELASRGIAATCIGDSLAPRTMLEAVREGHRVAVAL